jgi:hypothetical protein
MVLDPDAGLDPVANPVTARVYDGRTKAVQSLRGGMIVALLLALLGTASTVEALTTRSITTVHVGAGAARLTIYTTGTGSLYVNVKGLVAGVWSEQLWSGTCDRLATRLVVLPALVIGSKGTASRTNALTASQAKAKALRLSRGRSTLCASLIAPRPPSPSPVPVSPSPVPSPTSPSLVPRSVDFTFAPGISQADRDRVTEGVAAAEDYLESHLGGRTPGVVQVSASADARCSSSGAPQGMTTGSQICLDLGTPYPTDWALVAAHEYYHTWQYALGCATTGPIWLVEGTAQYVGSQAVVEAGLDVADTVRNQVLSIIETNPMPPLSSFENSWTTANGSQYSLAWLGIELLTKNSGLGSLRAYCVGVGAGENWSQAFETAFGTTPAQFYASFEAYRLSVRPAGSFRITGSVSSRSGATTAGDSITACPTAGGVCMGGTLGSDGSFSVLVSAGKYRLGINRPGQPPTTPPFGWYAPSGVVTDGASATVLDATKTDLTGINLIIP